MLAVVYGRVIAEWLHHEPPLSERPNVGLEVFILQAIRSGLEVHEGLNKRGGSNGYTPLKAMLSAFCCFWDWGNMVPQSKLHKGLITWLRLPERAGVDLCEHGKEELCSFELHESSHTPESMFVDWTGLRVGVSHCLASLKNVHESFGNWLTRKPTRYRMMIMCYQEDS